MEEVKKAFLARAVLCGVAVPIALVWFGLIGWTLEAARSVDSAVLRSAVGHTADDAVSLTAALVLLAGPLAATWVTLVQINEYVASTKKGAV